MTAMTHMPNLWEAVNNDFREQFQRIPKPVAPGDFATPCAGHKPSADANPARPWQPIGDAEL